MFSMIQPHFRQIFAHEIMRGHVVSFDGGPSSTAIVESCEEQGANIIVRLIGESPVLVSKDRRVSVFSYSS